MECARRVVMPGGLETRRIVKASWFSLCNLAAAPRRRSLLDEGLPAFVRVLARKNRPYCRVIARVQCGRERHVEIVVSHAFGGSDRQWRALEDIFRPTTGAFHQCGLRDDLIDEPRS